MNPENELLLELTPKRKPSIPLPSDMTEEKRARTLLAVLDKKYNGDRLKLAYVLVKNEEKLRDAYGDSVYQMMIDMLTAP